MELRDTDRYILDDQMRPVPEPDLLKWGMWMEQARHDRGRIVQQDFLEGSEERVGVSTVFLGLDHSFSRSGPPVLWETLVFGTSLDGEMERYTSYEAALLGHARIVAQVREAWAREHPEVG